MSMNFACAQVYNGRRPLDPSTTDFLQWARWMQGFSVFGDAAGILAAEGRVVLAAHVVGLATVRALAVARPALSHLRLARQVEARLPRTLRRALPCPVEEAAVPIPGQLPVHRPQQPCTGSRFVSALSLADKARNG